VGTDICDNPYGLFEGLFERIYRVPRVAMPGYADAIERVCRVEQIDVGILIPELEVAYWSGRRFPVPAAIPPEQFCAIAVSKQRLFEALTGTGLVPESHIVSRADLLNRPPPSRPPCWIRDVSEGNSSGKGALLAHNADELRAWIVLNPATTHFMISEFLPGRNFACHLLYDEGTVVKVASYERLEYFMARTAVSGITGNISRGRLVNDPRLEDAAQSAVDSILRRTGEIMHGIVAIDFKEALTSAPLITEINLRHVAATYAFAAAGFNISESHLLVALGRSDEVGPQRSAFPDGNVILRDIDGPPIWLEHYAPLAVGEFAGAPRSTA
jgi:hypothetical protein